MCLLISINGTGIISYNNRSYLRNSSTMISHAAIALQLQGYHKGQYIYSYLWKVEDCQEFHGLANQCTVNVSASSPALKARNKNETHCLQLHTHSHTELYIPAYINALGSRTLNKQWHFNQGIPQEGLYLEEPHVYQERGMLNMWLRASPLKNEASWMMLGDQHYLIQVSYTCIQCVLMYKYSCMWDHRLSMVGLLFLWQKFKTE